MTLDISTSISAFPYSSLSQANKRIIKEVGIKGTAWYVKPCTNGHKVYPVFPGEDYIMDERKWRKVVFDE